MFLTNDVSSTDIYSGNASVAPDGVLVLFCTLASAGFWNLKLVSLEVGGVSDGERWG